MSGNRKKMGRPVLEIDFSVLEGMCAIQCTLPEIAGVLGVSEDTVQRRCQDHYDETFAATYKKHAAPGLMSLRRNQFKMAETNPTIAIWLGKQYLGQADKLESAVKTDLSDADVTRIATEVESAFGQARERKLRLVG